MTSHSRVASLKDCAVQIVLVLGFYYVTYYAPSSSSPSQLSGSDSNDPLQRTRTVASLGLVAAIVVVRLFDECRPVTMTVMERKWHAIAWAGNSVFFTSQSLYLSTVYFGFSAWAEAFGGSDRRAACYAWALFAGTLGSAMTLLFLLLNWCDRAFHRELEDSSAARAGQPVKAILLAVHLPSVWIHVIDLTMVKDRALLVASAPPAASVLAAIAIYVLSYTAWIMLNHKMNGGYWPYPFVTSVLEAPQPAAAVTSVALTLGLDTGVPQPETCCTRPARWLGFLAAMAVAFSVIFAALAAAVRFGSQSVAMNALILVAVAPLLAAAMQRVRYG